MGKTSAPVVSRISAAARSRLAAVRLQMASRAPSSASTSAHARPRPALAPPMMATLPLSSRSIRDSPFTLRPSGGPGKYDTLAPHYSRGNGREKGGGPFTPGQSRCSFGSYFARAGSKESRQSCGCPHSGHEHGCASIAQVLLKMRSFNSSSWRASVQQYSCG